MIATTAAGSRQQSRFLALMEDYDRTLELTTIATESQGKADEQFAKYSDTVEYKLNQLKNTWEQFRISLLESDTYKSIIEWLTKVVEKLNDMTKVDLIGLGTTFLLLGKTVIPFLLTGISGITMEVSKAVEAGIRKAGENALRTINELTIKEDQELINNLKGTEQQAVNNIKTIETEIDNLQRKLRNLTNESYTVKLQSNISAAQKKITPQQQIINQSNAEIKRLKTEAGKYYRLQNQEEIAFRQLVQEHSATHGTTTAHSEDYLRTIGLGPKTYQTQIDAIKEQQKAQRALIGQAQKEINYHQNIISTSEKEIQTRQADAAATREQIRVRQENYTQAQKDFEEAQQNLSDEEEKQQLIRENQYKTRGRVIGQTFATAITVGITTALTTNDPVQAFGTTIVTGLVALISQMIQLAAAGGEGITAAFIGSTGLIGLGIVAVTAAVTGAIVLIKNAIKEQENQKIENRIANLNKQIDELKNNISKTNDELRKTKDEAKNLEDLRDTYERLSNKIILSEEEQEEYNSLIEQLQESYPELISYYDSENNKIKISNTLLEQKLKLLQEQEEVQAKQQYYQQMSLVSTQRDIKRLEIVNSSNFQNFDEKDFQKIVAGQNFSVKWNNWVEGSWFFAPKKQMEFTSDGAAFQIEESELLNTWQKYIDPALSELSIEQINVFKEVYEDVLNGEHNTNEKVSKEYEILAEVIRNQIEGQREDWNEVNKISEQVLLNIKTRLQELYPEANIGGQSYAAYYAADIESKINAALPGQHTGQDAPMQNLIDQIEAVEDSGEELPDLIYDVYDALKISQEIQEGWNAKNDYGSLGYEAKNFLREVMGIEGAIDYKKFFVETNLTDTEISDEISKAYKAWMIEQIAKQKLNELPDELTNNLSDLMANFSQFSLDEVEQRVKSLSGDNSEEYEKIMEILRDLYQPLQDSVDYAEKVGLENASQYKAKYVEAYTSYIKQLKDDFGDVGQDFGSSIVEIFQEAGLSIQQALAVVQGIDWKEIDFSNFASARNIFTENARSILGDAFDQDYIDKLWEDFYSESQRFNMVDITIKNVYGVENIKETIEEKLSETISSFSDVAGAIEMQLTEGELNYTEFAKLSETLKEFDLNINDYIDVSSGKLELQLDKLEDAYFNEIGDQDKLIELAKQKINEQIKNLELQQQELQQSRVKLNLDEAGVELEKEKLKIQAEILKSQELIDDTQYQKLTDLADNISIDTEQVKKIYDEQDKQISDTINGLRNTLEDKDGELSILTAAARAAWLEIGEQRNEAYQNAANTLQKEAEEAQKAIEEVEKAEQERLEKIQDALDEVNDIEEDIIDAQKDIEEAEQEILDAENDIVEKTKELNEALYGTDLWKSSLDDLYNYTILLDRLTKKIDKAKEAIDDLSRDSNARELLDNYAGLIHQESVIRQAENSVIEQSIANYMGILESQYSNYFYTLGDRLAVNWGTLVNAPMNNSLKEWVASTIEQINKLKDQQDDNLDSIEKREKEFQEQRKTALDNYVKLEDDVVKILEEKYKQEVEDTKEKYDALKEADDDYLSALEDAINKQRQLRERQDQWGELAQKEKKLSLISRDTSGANQKEQLSLQKEIEEDRQSLLDNAVDDIINSLKEMYELQQETRDAEIEYQEAVLDNANLVKEANDIIMNQWQSPEDAIAWFYENNMEVAEMSAARLEQYTMEIESAYAQKDAYIETSRFNFDNALTTEQWEVENAINIISQTLTNEAWRSSEETQRAVAEEQEKAQEALNQAYEGLDNAYEKLDENIAKMNELQDNLAVARQNYIDAMNDVTDTAMGDIDQVVAKLIDYTTQWTQSHEQITEQINAENEHHARLASDYESEYQYALQNMQGSIGYAWEQQNRNLEEIINRARAEGISFNGAHFYASGGLVNYTGPAWVDGSPSNPEAFLSADDTRRIGEAAQLLSNLPIFDSSNSTQQISTNVGDTNVEIHITVENISDDYDVDQAVERVQQKILEVARPVGTSVILRKN